MNCAFNARLPLFLLTIAVMAEFGCSIPTRTGYSYDIMVKNTGSNSISDCTITSAEGFWNTVGYVGAGYAKGLAGPFKQTYADRWTLRWDTAAGRTTEKSLDLSNAFPKSFYGRLVFTIDGQNNLSHVQQPSGDP